MAHFSARTAWDTSESALAQCVRERRAAGLPLIDLTISNPTVCGFEYGPILAPLHNAAALTYDPNPKGLRSARQAVAAYYAGHHAYVDPEEIILTTSTSEAYSFLFRLLCDPGDAVLVAQPSYPLFDFLADLDDVRLESYPLFEDFGWWIDFAELEGRIDPRTRAIVVVHPNNPTGHATSRPEREQLEALCVRHNLALIVDEVFLDYGLTGEIESFAVGEHPCPTFVVSGLSKIAALPQMKVGWIACFGPDRDAALSRLEIVADTFLSMNAPAQLGLPSWLGGSHVIRAQILDRVRENVALLGEGSARLIPVAAGWSGVLQLRQRLASETLAIRLVQEAGIIVHPGSFYGIPGGSHIVVSLIGPAASFAEGVQKLNEWCESNQLT
jgi:aspartate/methionine/tyrosine aminotransferase